MNNRFIFGRLVVMLVGFVLIQGIAVGAEQGEPEAPAPVEAPSAVTEVDGNIVSLDLVKQRVKLKDTHDQTVTLQITKATVISSAMSNKLVLNDLKVNDKIHAYYTTADRKARQIDVSPAHPVIRELETR